MCECTYIYIYNGSWVGALAPARGCSWRGSMGEAHPGEEFEGRGPARSPSLVAPPPGRTPRRDVETRPHLRCRKRGLPGGFGRPGGTPDRTEAVKSIKKTAPGRGSARTTKKNGSWTSADLQNCVSAQERLLTSHVPAHRLWGANSLPKTHQAGPKGSLIHR